LGATPPGIAGDVQFDGLTDTVINSLGHVVVQGHLAGDDLTLQPGGEGYTDDTGIWFWADGRLEQVVRKGDEIEVRDNDVRRITSIDFYGFVESSGNSDGLPSPFSDEDDIAFGMRFDDGSRGVFVASVSLEPLAGDFNNDGVVDAGDYVVWRKGLGTLYNSSHFNQWRANFGETLGSGTSGAVPEPSSWLICIVFTAIAILRRRAGRRR
jgi:hypothetical protein